MLGAISSRVLVVHGEDTKPFWIRSARHVADHATDALLEEIPAAGHASPLTHPEALAEAFTGFFSPLQARAT